MKNIFVFTKATLERRANRPGSQQMISPALLQLTNASHVVRAADGDRPRSVVKIIFTALLTALLTVSASAQTTFTTNVTVNTAIPDNDPNGLASAFTLSGLDGSISNLTVSVNLTGGFNGDLYAYLTGPGGFAVLLNRVGVSSKNVNGFSDPGFNVTFLSGGADFHAYGAGGFSTNGLGQVTGNWGVDGRSISPLSAGAAFDSAGRTALLDSFYGTNPNGLWGFFIADYSNGDIATLVSYGVSITTIPEPGTLALLVTSSLALLAGRRKIISK